MVALALPSGYPPRMNESPVPTTQDIQNAETRRRISEKQNVAEVEVHVLATRLTMANLLVKGRLTSLWAKRSQTAPEKKPGNEGALFRGRRMCPQIRKQSEYTA